jgi:hypothetical protein
MTGAVFKTLGDNILPQIVERALQAFTEAVRSGQIGPEPPMTLEESWGMDVELADGEKVPVRVTVTVVRK